MFIFVMAAKDTSTHRNTLEVIVTTENFAYENESRRVRPVHVVGVKHECRFECQPSFCF